MTSQPNRIPDWLLEQLAAGELPPSRAAELHATLAAQGEEHRLAAIAESNKEILAALPAEQVVAEIERRAARRQALARRPRPVFALSLVAACAAGLAVFVLAREPEPTERIKGLTPSLRIHRQTKTGDEVLKAGALVRKGNNLQLRYVAAGKRFGVIASIDARGTVTLHLPEVPGPAVVLERGGESTLPHAYELDDSPGFERFVFVTSDSPFTSAEVVSALKSGNALPSGITLCERCELVLQKATQ